jgi:hypothetical protein
MVNHTNQRRKVMNSTKKQRSIFSLYLVLVLVAAHIIAAHSFASEDFNVSIGGSSWKSNEAASHDISRGALEGGQNSFVVSSSKGDAFQITLSEKQIEDILAGSTVVVETESGNQKVTIAPKHKKPARSGW